MQGKSAAEAYAQAKARGPAIEAEANLAASAAALKVARDKVAAGRSPGGLISPETLSLQKDKEALRLLEVEHDKLLRTTDSIVAGVNIAIAKSAANAGQKTIIATTTEARNLNDKIKQFKESGDAAAAAA